MKKKVAVWYKKAFDEVVGPRYAGSAPPPGVTADRYKRQHGAVEYLTEHFHEAPVWIVACLEDGANPNRGAGRVDLSGGAEHAAGDPRAWAWAPR